ncbi:hypothetical protein [Embleya sp. NPDC020630]|uniref:hypothetical protein n=1 Tax=Embleya sp. NPDC020630 TaxID=3363979 RepID=UPI0037B4D665
MIRYSITEVSDLTAGTVTYAVRRGHRIALTTVVSGSARALHDTWPLRRDIAAHAGVDPDRVEPDWDHDPHRRRLRRFAPHTWHVRTDIDQIPGQTDLTTSGDEG